MGDFLSQISKKKKDEKKQEEKKKINDLPPQEKILHKVKVCRLKFKEKCKYYDSKIAEAKIKAKEKMRNKQDTKSELNDIKNCTSLRTNIEKQITALTNQINTFYENQDNIEFMNQMGDMNTVIADQLKNLDRLQSIVDQKKELDEEVADAKALMNELQENEEYEEIDIGDLLDDLTDQIKLDDDLEKNEVQVGKVDQVVQEVEGEQEEEQEEDVEVMIKKKKKQLVVN